MPHTIEYHSSPPYLGDMPNARNTLGTRGTNEGEKAVNKKITGHKGTGPKMAPCNSNHAHTCIGDHLPCPDVNVLETKC